MTDESTATTENTPADGPTGQSPEELLGRLREAVHGVLSDLNANMPSQFEEVRSDDTSTVWGLRLHDTDFSIMVNLTNP